MKIYTKAGDMGETSLCGGKRVSKTDPLVCACGDLDELNCLLGEIASAGGSDLLKHIQKDLFNIGSVLAGAKVEPEFKVEFLENEIDRIDCTLPKLTSFILPGGCTAAAKIHTARAVCRRAERGICGISGNKKILAPMLRYLNRLSDLLFVLARYTNMEHGCEDIILN